jgi:hypothetical protein
MENVIETNGEPVTIKITIEIITGEKKEDKKVETLVVPTTPEGWKEVEPTPDVDPSPVVKPEEPEMTFEPIVPLEKKKRAYTKKAKEVVVPVEEEKKVEPSIEEKLVEVVPPKVETKPAVPANKVIARLAQMIRFYCKASGISTTEITKKYLTEHGAADIIEGVTDDVVEEAIREASGK